MVWHIHNFFACLRTFSKFLISWAPSDFGVRYMVCIAMNMSTTKIKSTIRLITHSGSCTTVAKLSDAGCGVITATWRDDDNMSRSQLRGLLCTGGIICCHSPTSYGVTIAVKISAKVVVTSQRAMYFESGFIKNLTRRDERMESVLTTASPRSPASAFAKVNAPWISQFGAEVLDDSVNAGHVQFPRFKPIFCIPHHQPIPLYAGTRSLVEPNVGGAVDAQDRRTLVRRDVFFRAVLPAKL